MTFRLGDSFQFGFNLFTGERGLNSYTDKPEGADRATMELYADNRKVFSKRLISPIPTGLLKNGVNYPFGLVEETEPRYRLGAAYMGWNNYRVGINSDRYVRYPIQVLAAHYYISPQPGQEVLSNAVKFYFQYQSRNKFTSW